MLLLLVKIQEKGTTLAFTIGHNNKISHRFIINLNERISYLEKNVFNKLRLLFVELDLVQIYGDICSNKEIKIITEEERVSENRLRFLESQFNFFRNFFFKEQKDQRILSDL